MQPQKAPFNPVWIIVIILVVVCGGGACMFGGCALVCGKAATDAAQAMYTEQSDKFTKTMDVLDQKPIEVTVGEIWKAYDENTVAADKKYLGKLVKVTGKIDRVSEMFGSFHVYMVEDVDRVQMTKVDIEYPMDMRDEVAKLKTGYIYDLQGICRGERMGIVSLDLKPE